MAAEPIRVDFAGTPLEFPAGTDPAVIQATVKKLAVERQAAPAKASSNPEESSTSLKNLAGAAVEPLAHLATGALAGPVAGLLGILGTALPGKSGQGAEWVKNVGEALTYQPKTSGGKIATDFITYPFQKIGEAGDYVGGKTAELTGSPAAGAFTNALLQTAAPLALAKGAAKVMPSSATSRIPGAETVNEILSLPVDAASAVGRGVRNIVQPYLGEAGLDAATGRAVRRVAGERHPAVIQALMDETSPVPGVNWTAGQAAVPAGSAEFSALQQIIKERDPSRYSDVGGVGGAQEAARLASLQGISQSQVPNAMADAVAARKAATAPLREQELANANVSGIKGSELATRASNREAAATSQVADVRRLSEAQRLAEETGYAGGRGRLGANSSTTAAGMPRAGGQYSYGKELADLAERHAQGAADHSLQLGAERRFAQMQADSIAQSGLAPLKADAVTRKIDAIANKPGFRSSDAVTETMSYLKEKIASLTNPKTGVINAEDLYTIRKEIGLSIENNAKAKGWDRRLTAGLETRIKGYIDDAISGAGGTQWKDYLRIYGEKSQPINEMVIGRELEKVYSGGLGQERATAFGNAVKSATALPELLRPSGAARYGDIREVMSPGKMQVVDALMADLKRNAAYETMASEGMKSARKRVENLTWKLPPTGMFSPILSVARGVVNRVGGASTEKIMENLDKKMDNPVEVARIMQEVTPQQRQLIIEYMMARNPALVGGAAFAAQQQGGN